MYLTSLVLLAVAGASAHPSGHAHAHLHRHHLEQKRNPAPNPAPNPAVGDLVTATIDGKVVHWTNTYDGKGSPFIQYHKPEAQPTPSPSPSPAQMAAAAVNPSPSSSSSSAAKPTPTGSKSGGSSGGNQGSGTGVGSYTPFCGGKQASKRATLAQIKYQGNTGTADNWGCNMLLVADEATASKYDYTIKFVNEDKSAQSCVCFNKIGPTGLVDGFFHEGLTWKMAPGATQYVAVDANSQGGCACNAGDTLRKAASNGQFAATWLEFDMANASNEGWSGADASSLVAQAFGMQVDGLRVCAAGVKDCSTIYPGGRGVFAYTKGMEDVDGEGIKVPPGGMKLTVQVGYS